MLPHLVPICREQHFRRRFIPVIASELFIQLIYRVSGSGAHETL